MTDRTQPRLVKFSDLDFVPRAEGGDMAQLAQICGTPDGTELGVGMGRLTNAWIEWTIKYDEVLTVLDGELKLHIAGRDEPYVLKPHDSIWLPEGTALVYEAESALLAYAIHPADWADRQ